MIDPALLSYFFSCCITLSPDPEYLLMAIDAGYESVGFFASFYIAWMSILCFVMNFSLLYVSLCFEYHMSCRLWASNKVLDLGIVKCASSKITWTPIFRCMFCCQYSLYFYLLLYTQVRFHSICGDQALLFISPQYLRESCTQKSVGWYCLVVLLWWLHVLLFYVVVWYSIIESHRVCQKKLTGILVLGQRHLAIIS